MLDPASAAITCRDIAATLGGIKTGRIKPDLFRVFTGGAWQVMRAGGGIQGCAAGMVALSGSADRSEAAIARGPAALDAFAAALSGSDPGPLLAAREAAGQEAALDRLMGLLNAQSRLMAAVLPAPPGAGRAVTLPSMELLPEDMRLSRLAILQASPGAQVDLEVAGCRLMLAMSAAPQALYEARDWGRPFGQDGAVSGAFVRRNAGGIVGRERTDGTGIEAVVDGHVIVRVVIPGNAPCAGDPGVVRRLFDMTLARDLSVFATPYGIAP